jgi:GH35 family endo-1,4-beta-xylanase
MTAHYLPNASLAYYAVDVVNEAVSDSGPDILKAVKPWYPAVPDYLSVAFTAARAADPTGRALLCE